MRAAKVEPHEPELLPVEQRAGFDLVEQTLTEEPPAPKPPAACNARPSATSASRSAPTAPTIPITLARYACAARAGLPERRLDRHGEEAFEFAQVRQIVHVDDFCNECGNCATFCVHQGKPYADKPRLFLETRDFRLERTTGSSRGNRCLIAISFGARLACLFAAALCAILLPNGNGGTTCMQM